MQARCPVLDLLTWRHTVQLGFINAPSEDNTVIRRGQPSMSLRAIRLGKESICSSGSFNITSLVIEFPFNTVSDVKCPKLGIPYSYNDIRRNKFLLVCVHYSCIWNSVIVRYEVSGDSSAASHVGRRLDNRSRSRGRLVSRSNADTMNLS